MLYPTLPCSKIPFFFGNMSGPFALASPNLCQREDLHYELYTMGDTVSK